VSYLWQIVGRDFMRRKSLIVVCRLRLNRLSRRGGCDDDESSVYAILARSFVYLFRNMLGISFGLNLCVGRQHVGEFFWDGVFPALCGDRDCQMTIMSVSGCVSVQLAAVLAYPRGAGGLFAALGCGSLVGDFSRRAFALPLIHVLRDHATFCLQTDHLLQWPRR